MKTVFDHGRRNGRQEAQKGPGNRGPPGGGVRWGAGVRCLPQGENRSYRAYSSYRTYLATRLPAPCADDLRPALPRLQRPGAQPTRGCRRLNDPCCQFPP